VGISLFPPSLATAIIAWASTVDTRLISSEVIEDIDYGIPFVFKVVGKDGHMIPFGFQGYRFG
jgi:hypothetical protein